MYNYKHLDTTCPECQHTEILEDTSKGETFCTYCGLVIQDQTIPSLCQLIREAYTSEKLKRESWEKQQ